jgi:hypothetical protein
VNHAKLLGLGIDPGANGAIAVATMAAGAPLVIDVLRLKGATTAERLDFLQAYAARTRRLWIEHLQPMGSGPGQRISGAAQFHLGRSYGEMCGLAIASGFAVEYVRPQAWQKAMLEGRTTRGDKRITREAAQRYGSSPGKYITPDGTVRRITDAEADAIIIAVYGLLQQART